MLTVLSVIGTRPEAIKMAPVLAQLDRQRERVRSVVCLTAQHRQMLDQVLGLFDIRPDYDLNLMEADQALSQLTARLFEGLDAVVQRVQPDWVLAQGDTTTVLVAALVAYYHAIPFGHVEAGLRTGDKRRPFPEEINRRVADEVADALFAPTRYARDALLRAGFPEGGIYFTGNTVVDALLEVAARPYRWDAGPLAPVPSDRSLVLVTAHRRESFGAPLEAICEAVRDLARRFADDGVHFVYPVHLNPNVRECTFRVLSGLPNVSLTDPLDYLSLVHLMKRSILILTDSGGIQEEAPSFGVPVLVMRETTERPEGVEAGVARIVGTQRLRIVEEATRLLRDPKARADMAKGGNPYGDGRASRRIAAILLGDPWEEI